MSGDGPYRVIPPGERADLLQMAELFIIGEGWRARDHTYPDGRRQAVILEPNGELVARVGEPSTRTNRYHLEVARFLAKSPEMIRRALLDHIYLEARLREAETLPGWARER